MKDFADYLKKTERAATYIRKKTKNTYSKDVLSSIILGSGYSTFADDLRILYKIPYEKIPGMNKSKVAGHSGEWLIIQSNENIFYALSGRLHYYEGYTMDEVVFPIFVLAKLGIQNLIITNAAGSVNLEYHPGDVVVIKDHINGMGVNPFRLGFLPENPFVDLSSVYDTELMELFKQYLQRYNIPFHLGVYYGNSGPAFETPAEIEMIRKLGGDMVGMSTIPEAIAAQYLGLKIFAFSIISNYGSGILEKNDRDKMDHALVLKKVSATIKEISPALNEMIDKLSESKNE